MTVAEVTAYYVEGQPMESGGRSPEDPERQRELGMPISADDTARHHTQADPQRPVNGGGWTFGHLPAWCGLDRTPPRASRAGDHQRQPETLDPDPVDVAVQQQLGAYQTTIFDHLPGIS